MNAERLNRILQIINEEFEKTNQIELIQGLIKGLNGQISEPQETTHQQNVAAALKELREILPNAESNKFSPAWIQILKELGLYDYLGNQLLNTINLIVQNNNITVSLAADEFTKLFNHMNALRIAVQQLVKGFKTFHIGYELLEVGECEVGILIPRIAVDNNLGKLRKELSDLEFILNHFAEVVQGEKPIIEIRALSSSDLSILLDYAPSAGAFLAVALERIVAAYKNFLEIKKLRLELKKMEVPENTLSELDEFINHGMQEEIIKFLDENFDTYCKAKDNGRKNELRTSLEIAMNKIANRVDRGFNFEIRVEYIKPEEIEGEEAEGKEPKIDKNVKTILDAQKSLEYIKAEGEPILSLPENDKPKTRSKK